LLKADLDIQAAVRSQSAVSRALVNSVAAGSSTTFVPGLTDFSDVPQLLEQISVTAIT
jgi:1-phosphofructokinase